MAAVANVKPGEEAYEYFDRKIGRKTHKLVQYDYRDKDGELFGCIAPDLEEARRRKDNWVKHNKRRKGLID